MKISELIERLQRLDPDSSIMILDGFNGGGNPREINLGPAKYRITEEDAKSTYDCEDLIGRQVYVLGFGCY